MYVDSASGVKVIGEPLAVADESARLLEIVAAAADRSSTSRLLAEQIDDWPTRQALSPLRSNLLRPLVVGPGDRVLEVGAGTGALTRYLAETGADVVAVEAGLDRARVAAVRCEGFGNVEILAGPLASYEPDAPFDLVVLAGAREAAGESGGVPALVEAALAALAPDGVVVLALENQLGLRCLLGYAEDFQGEPWVGIEAFQIQRAVRTYSRGALGRLLAESGLTGQRWLYPFPDHRFPTVVVSDTTYDESDVVSFVDQMVREPCGGHEQASALIADARGVHRVLLDAGLGRDIANSFLVLGARDPEALDRRLDPQVLAWRYGSQRARVWQHTTVVRNDGDVRVVERTRAHPGDGRPERGWVSQSQPDKVKYLPGWNLEQLVMQAAADHDTATMGQLLQRWRRHLESVLTGAPGDDHPVHPFLPADSELVLPARYLDTNLDNFVPQGDELIFIDDEWHAEGGVDFTLAVARGLAYLARELIVGFREHPWSPTITVDELTLNLARLAATDLDSYDLRRWQLAEGEFQAVAHGASAAEVVDELATLGRSSRLELAPPRALPYTLLHRERIRLGEDLLAHRAELNKAEEAHRVLTEERARREALEAMIEQLKKDTRELNAIRHRLNVMESRWPLRLYRKVKKLIS
ncbi:MAG: hypothetical protein JJLCMIEE_03484 [Acidimicrobiales bacterium]|nr:MAG: methyltransferase domain-containing protein [Actinomycetota bacterium]MBV6510344.1 hypothetical protein [Acidimicrobiales bacterium]RIK02890.1 MAG: hypothetical protein DCC48_17480 [Acidobacteriota bacterium]